MTEGRARSRGPILFAHRGACDELPENTLPAFRRALEVGATALETDVHVTRDGHVVVSHDPDVARTAGHGGTIRDALLRDVKSWDVGAIFRTQHPEKTTARFFEIPTLGEVLDALGDVSFNVDIKQHDARAARAVVETVRRHGAEDRVRLASFSSATLRQVRALGYAGPTSLGVSEILRLALLPKLALSLAPLAGTAAQIPTAQGIRLDTASFIDKAHALGLAVHYWTIDEPSEAERLLALGADGIMTNEPRRLAPLFARG